MVIKSIQVGFRIQNDDFYCTRIKVLDAKIYECYNYALCYIEIKSYTKLTNLLL